MDKRNILIALLMTAIFVIAIFLINQLNNQLPADSYQDIKTDDSQATPEATKAHVQANNTFAFNLHNKIKSRTKNVFFSPYSISTAMAMAYEGSKDTTANEIRAVMGYSSDPTEMRSSYAFLHNRYNPETADYELNLANAFWVEQSYPFLVSYVETLKTSYASKANSLDFINDTEASRGTINRWVEENTNNKIVDLMPQGSITGNTRLVLTNAIYFKGNWKHQFDKSKTSVSKFFVSTDAVVNVPMMKQDDASFNYYSNNDLQALEMLYKGEQLSMLVLLPSDNDISKLDQYLNTESLSEIRQEMYLKSIEVFFPKFTFNSDFSLNNTLFEMGIEKAFTKEADFSGMDGTKNLSISSVIHKAFVDVNEEGTEAAAATGISVGVTAIETDVFKANHPFVFFIIDRENENILFMGVVNNPTKK